MPNHLSHETSPYLLQHANNPVDWYPWSEEAFTLAREQGRPFAVMGKPDLRARAIERHARINRSEQHADRINEKLPIPGSFSSKADSWRSDNNCKVSHGSVLLLIRTPAI